MVEKEGLIVFLNSSSYRITIKYTSKSYWVAIINKLVAICGCCSEFDIDFLRKDIVLNQRQ